MTFGEKLKEIRLSLDMSQQDFATMLRTSKQVISRYELEQTTPKIGVAANFCKILNISLDSMINDDVGIAVHLTPHEGKVITAYREKPLVQPAVDKLLDVLPEEPAPITPLFDDPVKIAPLHLTNPEDAPRLRLADSPSFDSLFDNKPTEE